MILRSGAGVLAAVKAQDEPAATSPNPTLQREWRATKQTLNWTCPINYHYPRFAKRRLA